MNKDEANLRADQLLSALAQRAPTKKDPSCEYEGCAKAADRKSLVITADKVTYARYFCDKHKDVGTEALTHVVADIEHRRIVRWDDEPTEKWYREQAQRREQEQKEWNAKTGEWEKKSFYNKGWRDFVHSESGVLDLDQVGHSTWAKINLELAQERYQQGWEAARQAEQEQEQGKAVFLLNEVVKQMEGGDEWYGTDFDEPIALIQRAIAEIRNEAKG